MSVLRKIRKHGLTGSARKASGRSYFVPESCKSADASVWDEKVLEHWIAAEQLGLIQYQPADIYVDIAAGNSPWVKNRRRTTR